MPRTLGMIFAAAAVLFAACGERAAKPTTPERAPPSPTKTAGAPTPTNSSQPAKATERPSRWETDSGLIIEELKVGNGAEARKFETVKVHYIGTLGDGTEFDDSYKRNQPLIADLARGVIKGWQEGIPGMKVGGKRRLIVPPDLGYGARGSPPLVPPNSTLVFEIELLDVVR